MSADRHWDALDHAFSRLLPPAAAARGHDRLARRAAALAAIYLPRLANLLGTLSADADRAGHQRALERTHRALSAALARARNRDSVHR